MTKEKLRTYLNYDKDTGYFVWLKGRFNGKRAGTIKQDGYVVIQINSKSYMAHVLSFIWMGVVRPSQIDHINRIKSDNRWSNLRASNNSLNQMNTTLSSRNKTGYRGVFYKKDKKKYAATLSYRENGKKINKHLGYFNNPIDAYAAYKQAAIERYGKEWVG